MHTLELACEQRVMHVELDLEGKILLLQVCQERNAGTIIVAERYCPDAAQIHLHADELLDELASQHPLT